MAIVSMKALLETGVHFGHRTRRWNPKMKPYIFTERNGIHILDLQQTIVLLEEAYNVVRDTVADGGEVLFVGTKRQAQDSIAREAARARMPYVNVRWLGGTLTNWQTIKQRIEYLDNLESRREAGDFDLLKKTERLRTDREIAKLELRLGGIRKMTRLPDLLFVIDVNNEETAVHEANILGIPVIGVVDTNADPDQIEYVIPSNDDAIRAIKLLTGKIADAALEGLAMRKEFMEEEITDFDAYEYEEFDGMGNVEDEMLLGESTLAKLRTQSAEEAGGDDDDFEEEGEAELEEAEADEDEEVGSDEENE
jgi:small subunit ribosomal protein S2